MYACLFNLKVHKYFMINFTILMVDSRIYVCICRYIFLLVFMFTAQTFAVCSHIPKQFHSISILTIILRSKFCTQTINFTLNGSVSGVGCRVPLAAPFDFYDFGLFRMKLIIMNGVYHN